MKSDLVNILKLHKVELLSHLNCRSLPQYEFSVTLCYKMCTLNNNSVETIFTQTASTFGK